MSTKKYAGENESGWKYYNHALMPCCKPHETANVDELINYRWWGVRRSLPSTLRTGTAPKKLDGIG